MIYARHIHVSTSQQFWLNCWLPVNIGKVCQTLSQWVKSSSHSNSWYTATKTITLSSVCQAPSHDPNFICLHQLQQSLFISAYYSSLSWRALWATSASSTINKVLELANFDKGHASSMKLSFYDGIWYTDHDSTTNEAVSRILMQWGNYFVHHRKF